MRYCANRPAFVQTTSNSSGDEFGERRIVMRRDLNKPFANVDMGSFDRSSTSRATKPITARIAAICTTGMVSSLRIMLSGVNDPACNVGFFFWMACSNDLVNRL